MLQQIPSCARTVPLLGAALQEIQSKTRPPENARRRHQQSSSLKQGEKKETSDEFQHERTGAPVPFLATRFPSTRSELTQGAATEANG